MLRCILIYPLSFMVRIFRAEKTSRLEMRFSIPAYKNLVIVSCISEFSHHSPYLFSTSCNEASLISWHLIKSVLSCDMNISGSCDSRSSWKFPFRHAVSIKLAANTAISYQSGHSLEVFDHPTTNFQPY